MENAVNHIPEDQLSFLKRFGWPIVFALVACYIGYKRITAPAPPPPSKSTSDAASSTPSSSSAAATAAAEARVAAAAARHGSSTARPNVLDRIERQRQLAAVVNGDFSGVPDRSAPAARAPTAGSGAAAGSGGSNSRPAGVSAGLIAEQDREYARAAAADLDRVAAAEAAADAAECARIAKAAAEADAAAAATKAAAVAARAAALARARAEATAARLAALGPEPAAGEAGCVLVGLRLPGGQRIQRRFRARGEVGGVRAWARAAADKDAEARAGREARASAGAGSEFTKRKALRLRDPLTKVELFAMREGSKLISEVMGDKLQQLLVLDDDDEDAEDDEDDVVLLTETFTASSD